MSHPPASETNLPAFTQLVNLAEERLGARVLSVSDDFFAAAENMLKPGRGVFIVDKYTDRGKWMDGWESRRKRVPGHDWCVLKLGLRGRIVGVDIDTNHFLGNHPPFASIDAANVKGVPTENDWRPILAKSPLKPGSQNLYAIENSEAWTHLRLNIFPDGGVARFKVYGNVEPDWSLIGPGEVLDLAAVQNGGRVLVANDMFFGPKDNLIMPGRGINMGDGWETRRKRQPGHDWVILQLGRPGQIKKIEVDTCHFKGNFPDMCSLDACMAPDASIEQLQTQAWKELMPKKKLEANTQHFFNHLDILPHGTVSHVRLNIYPDGGVSRLRLNGVLG
jgi:allantoicase